MVYPLGKDCVGVLIYDNVGNMAAQLMRPNCPAFKSGDMRKGTSEEIKAAFNGFIAYFGTYEINAGDKTVTHCIEGSLFPNWVGERQVRHYAFEGNRMTLSTPPIPLGGASGVGVLEWERQSM
jgi:hypothetical protein